MQKSPIVCVVALLTSVASIVGCGDDTIEAFPDASGVDASVGVDASLPGDAAPFDANAPDASAAD